MKFYNVYHWPYAGHSYKCIVEADSPEDATQMYSDATNVLTIKPGDSLEISLVNSSISFYFYSVLTKSGMELISSETIKVTNASS